MRRHGRGDDGSLPLATLVIVIAVGLSILLMTTMTRETVNTRTAQNRAAALLAARTGLASALASLRGAQDVDHYGVEADLPPCSTAVTGTLGSNGAVYAANIWYLTQPNDPKDHDAAWAATHGKPCYSQLADRAQWAYVVATGKSADGKHSRTLLATYQFRLQGKGNVPGGQIMLYKTSSQDWCLTAAPSSGADLTLEICAYKTDGAIVDNQLFGYMEDLTIRQMMATNKEGLCADAGSPQKIGNQVKLQKCKVGSPALPQQQWSFDQNSNFRGTSDGKTLNNFCWTMKASDRKIYLNDMAGGLLGYPKRCGQTLTDYQSWNVSPTAGSGAAADPASGQLVNFRQFGKCFDYTGYRTDGSTLGDGVWAFPCKQSPSIPDRSISQVWNQIWITPKPADGPGLIYTVDPVGAKRCLRVPGFSASRPYAATADTCPSATAANRPQFLWQMRGADAPTYDEKYRIEGTGAWAGKCLAPVPGPYSVPQADWIGFVPCSGDWMQKWNAVPPISTSGLTNVTEQ